MIHAPLAESLKQYAARHGRQITDREANDGAFWLGRFIELLDIADRQRGHIGN